jgi:hypothetical protein
MLYPFPRAGANLSGLDLEQHRKRHGDVKGPGPVLLRDARDYKRVLWVGKWDLRARAQPQRGFANRSSSIHWRLGFSTLDPSEHLKK